VVHENQSVGVRLCRERVRDFATQPKTGTAIRDRDHAIAETFAHRRFTSACVRHGEDRIGVRVQNRRRRKERVQQRFDRRPRAGRIDEAAREVIHHFLVAHLHIAMAERFDVVEANGRELLRHDRFHVAAAALDEHHRNGVAEEVGGGGFDAVVAAAPENERFLQPNQTGLLHELIELGFGSVGPAVEHGRE